MIDKISVDYQAPRGAPALVSQVDYPIKIDYNEEKIINKNILINLRNFMEWCRIKQHR